MPELTPAQHAAIRRQLLLIPVYIWVVYSWTNLLTRIPNDTPVRDFAHFYVQGVVARDHDATALYDIDALEAITARVVPGAQEKRYPYPPVYGPQVSVLFGPLARLPYRTARNVWLVVSLVLYGICCYAVWRVCPALRRWRAMALGLAVAAPALHYMLGYVQVSAIGLACVTGGYLALRANRPLLAGLAIGSLAYKPPLGLAFAFVLIASREWRMVIGAAAAAAAQIAIGVLYWGPSILPPYLSALTNLPQVATAMEPNRYHMHSWRAFFDLLGLPPGPSLAAYVVASVVTALVAFRCWKSQGPLALRYSAVIVASVLVDPHLFAYDLVLLTPALMLLTDWTLATDWPLTTGHWPLATDRWPLATDRWPLSIANSRLLGILLYACYFAPLSALMADLAHVQGSVLAFFILELVVLRVLSATPTESPSP